MNALATTAAAPSGYEPTAMNVQGSLGRYTLIRRLAKGGMGEVFLAQTEGPAGFAKVVVVKRILKELAEDSDFVRLFLNEARLTALVSHPNVVQVFELGQHEGSYFLSMEYVHGQSLRALLRWARSLGQQFPVWLAARVCIDVLRGLHAAHTMVDEVGTPFCIVHRDVSPDNMLVSYSGAAKIADFGVAKTTSVNHTQSGLVRGKLHYMAPEQVGNEPLDGRTDVYGVAAVLYEALTGRAPFDGNSDARLLLNLMSAPLIAPRLLRDDIPPELDALVVRGLNRDRALRPASALDFAQALEECIRDAHVAAGPAELAEFIKELLGDEMTISSPGVRTPAAPTLQAPGSATDDDLIPLLDDEELLIEVGPTLSLREGAGQTGPAATPPRRSWHRLGGLAFALAVLLAGGVVLAGTMRRPSTAAAGRPHALAVRPPVPTAQVEVVPAADPQVLPVAPLLDAPEWLPEVRATRMHRRTAAAAPSSAVAAKSGTGHVMLRVNPWAHVSVDGIEIGTTPLAPLALNAGQHTLRFDNPDLMAARTVIVDVVGGEVTDVKVNLLR